MKFTFALATRLQRDAAGWADWPLDQGTLAPTSLVTRGNRVSEHAASERHQAFIQGRFNLGQCGSRMCGAPGIHIGKNIQTFRR
jgi:hypothetical protein